MSTIILKEYAIDNKKAQVFRDEFPPDPRDDDNLGTMICFHGNYILGDLHDVSKNDFDSWQEVVDYLKENFDAEILIPMYIYEHSGIAINTTGFRCPWDSGKLGYIFASKEDILEAYGVDELSQEIIDKAKTLLEAEVKEYHKYLNGENYGVRVVEEIEHKWGDMYAGTEVNVLEHYHGIHDLSAAKEEAKSSLGIETNVTPDMSTGVVE